MATLQELRSRVKSIKSTQKITKAMKIVAAAKMKRMRGLVEHTAEYTKSIASIICSLAHNAWEADLSDLKRRMLLEDKKEYKKEVVIVLSADKGLCGSFNSSLLRNLKRHLDAMQDFRLILVGRRGYEYLKQRYNDRILLHEYNSAPPEALANSLLEAIYKEFESHESICIKVYFTQFKSALMQFPVIRRLLPFDMEANAQNDILTPSLELEGKGLAETVMDLYLRTSLIEYILNSRVSEEASRMTAMESANSSAKKVLDKLTISMNRKRQAMITNELIEVISGASSV